MTSRKLPHSDLLTIAPERTFALRSVVVYPDLTVADTLAILLAEALRFVDARPRRRGGASELLELRGSGE